MVSLLAVAALSGTLCFVQKGQPPKCQATAAESVAIEPADAERAFVWTSADGKRVVIGTAPAKEASVEVAGDFLRDVTLALTGDRTRGWPADVRVFIGDADKHEWGWVIPRKRVPDLSVIAAKQGRYAFMFGADHHLTARRELVVVKDASLREVALKPRPIVTAKIVTKKNEPVPGARVTAGKEVIATSDEQGNVRGELVEPLPDSLLIEKSGYGSLIVPLRPGSADASLGTIEFGSAHKLALTIVRPDSAAVTVRVERNNNFKYEHTHVVTKSLAKGDSSISLDDLGAATYYVAVEGKEPLERMVEAIEINEGDVEKTIKVEPFRLDGSVVLGDDPFNGKISLQDRDHVIRTEVNVEAGHFGGSMWQPGSLSAFVSGPALQPGEFMNSPELGADPSVWKITFPKRFITGRVFDADTGKPLPAASMELYRVSGDNRFYSSMKTDADGGYSVAAFKPGTYQLTVQIPSYVPAKVAVEVNENDPSIQRDIALSHGFEVPIQVVSTAGAPIPNAPVLEGMKSDGHNAENYFATDGSGTLNLRVASGQQRTLYVLPQEGSFAVIHLAAPASADDVKPIRVVVPPPAGSVKLKFSTPNERKQPWQYEMRFNGEFIPAVVWQHLPHGQGWEIRALPAGSYEVWPTMYGRGTAPIGPSKTVGISSGPVEVELTVDQGH